VKESKWKEKEGVKRKREEIHGTRMTNERGRRRRAMERGGRKEGEEIDGTRSKKEKELGGGDGMKRETRAGEPIIQVSFAKETYQNGAFL